MCELWYHKDQALNVGLSLLQLSDINNSKPSLFLLLWHNDCPIPTSHGTTSVPLAWTTREAQRIVSFHQYPCLVFHLQSLFTGLVMEVTNLKLSPGQRSQKSWVPIQPSVVLLRQRGTQAVTGKTRILSHFFLTHALDVPPFSSLGYVQKDKLYFVEDSLFRSYKCSYGEFQFVKIHWKL